MCPACPVCVQCFQPVQPVSCVCPASVQRVSHLSSLSCVCPVCVQPVQCVSSLCPVSVQRVSSLSSVCPACPACPACVLCRQVQQMKVPVVSRWQSWRRSKARSLRRFQEDASGALAHIELWRRSLHEIGGYFGGGVQSYFLFLRFLVDVVGGFSYSVPLAYVLTCLFYFLFCLGWIVTRALLHLLVLGLIFAAFFAIYKASEASQVGLWLPSPGRVSVCLQQGCLVLVLEGQSVSLCCSVQSVSVTVLISSLSLPQGFMEFSYLFYGYYQDTKVDVVGGFSYSVPLAYVLTCLFYFLFCLGWIVTRAGGLVRVVVATGGGAGGGYSLQVLAGWDHGLQGDRATRLRQSGLRYQLQMDLEEQALRRQARSRSPAQWAGLVSLRALLHLLVLGLIFAAFFAIYKASEASQVCLQQGCPVLVLEGSVCQQGCPVLVLEGSVCSVCLQQGCPVLVLEGSVCVCSRAVQSWSWRGQCVSAVCVLFHAPASLCVRRLLCPEFC
ncbi:TMC7 protein, partial [Atractosteus spatula]|nr:TMC7 protein [Atractosteus spatula]